MNEAAGDYILSHEEFIRDDWTEEFANRFQTEDEEGGGANEMARNDEWGGSEPDPTHYDINQFGANKDSHRDAVKYQREKYGKREFKRGSPLHPGKGSTIVKAEGLLNQLKQRFNKNTKDKSILSEENLIKDEEISE